MKEIKITQLEKSDLANFRKFTSHILDISSFCHGLSKTDLERFNGSEKLDNFYFFSIRKAEEIYRDILIGLVSLFNIDWISRHCQIGFVLNVDGDLDNIGDNVIS